MSDPWPIYTLISTDSFPLFLSLFLFLFTLSQSFVPSLSVSVWHCPTDDKANDYLILILTHPECLSPRPHPTDTDRDIDVLFIISICPLGRYVACPGSVEVLFSFIHVCLYHSVSSHTLQDYSISLSLSHHHLPNLTRAVVANRQWRTELIKAYLFNLSLSNKYAHPASLSGNWLVPEERRRGNIKFFVVAVVEIIRKGSVFASKLL